MIWILISLFIILLIINETISEQMKDNENEYEYENLKELFLLSTLGENYKVIDKSINEIYESSDEKKKILIKSDGDYKIIS